MTDAPETIYAAPNLAGQMTSPYKELITGEPAIEYTRTDIADARIAELEEALESILKIPNSEAAQGIMKVFAHSALGDKT